VTPLSRIVAVVVLTAIVAAAGGWAGIQYGLRQAHAHQGLDELIHSELNLSAEQDRRIEALEAEFATRREMLEQEMRAANRDLAAAIAAEHEYGPRAQSAIERFHMAERSLQEETVKHVLAMRTVMTPEQMSRFDQAIAKELTAD
jgi:nickel and cobalt resistance protein CnrR